MAVIAIDLGGTKIASALFDARGRIRRRSVVIRGERTGRAVAALVRRELAGQLKFADRHNLSLEAVGICVPGIAHQQTGRVWAPNIPGWTDYPLRDEIRAALGRRKIPVIVDSDRAAYVLGETWQGAAHGCRDAIFLAVGTGIGAGILVHGEVLRGAHDIAGAIGWMALERPFVAGYVACGCFERHASGAGLARMAKVMFTDKNYRGPFRGKRRFTAQHIFTAAARGDIVAQIFRDQTIEYWGMAAANLVSLFNPEKIIFGGGVFGPATRFLKQIRAEATKWAQPISMKRVQFEPSELGGAAGLYGAAFLALRAARASR